MAKILISDMYCTKCGKRCMSIPRKKGGERDLIKNQWCRENDIPLIRIPYTHLTQLCIEDLLLETSQFLI